MIFVRRLASQSRTIEPGAVTAAVAVPEIITVPIVIGSGPAISRLTFPDISVDSQIGGSDILCGSCQKNPTSTISSAPSDNRTVALHSLWPFL